MPKQRDFRPQTLFLGLCYFMGFNEEFYEEGKKRDKKKIPYNEHLLGTSLSAWCSLISPSTCETSAYVRDSHQYFMQYFINILKLRMVKSPAQDHTAKNMVELRIEPRSV